MPQDAVFGRDLARQLTEKYLGRIDQVFWTYDSSEINLVDEITTTESWCRVTPFMYEDERLTRAHWKESIQIVVSLISKAGSKSDEAWIDSWLDSWDGMVRWMRETKVLGRHKPSSVIREDRYDPDVFHNHQRLFTQALVSFENVEVT